MKACGERRFYLCNLPSDLCNPQPNRLPSVLPRGYGFPIFNLQSKICNRVDTARIAHLLEPFLQAPLSALEHISTYIDLLQRWNARVNLTAIRSEDEIVTRHFGESLFLARHLFPRHAISCHPERNLPPVILSGAERPASPIAPRSRRTPIPSPNASSELEACSSKLTVLDIGSGAGFPALPLKIWAPEIAITLVESNHKKAAFLREVIRALTLTNVNVITARAETLTQAADVVTLRAVERFDSVVPVAERLVAAPGRLALLIGTSQLQHLPSSLTWSKPVPIPNSESRVLIIGVRP